VGRRPAGDVDGQRGAVGAAEMADVTVPVGDRDDNAAGAVVAGHRVLVGQAAGPVGRSPGTAGDHLPGGDLVRGGVCGHRGQTIVSWSKIFDGTSPGDGGTIASSTFSFSSRTPLASNELGGSMVRSASNCIM